MTISANEGLESEDVGASNAETSHAQVTDAAHDNSCSVDDSAHILPTRQQLRASGPAMNALKSGRRSRRLQHDAAPWRVEQITAIRADLGDDISTLKGHTIEQLGTVLVILRFLSESLMAEGPLTAKGRQRAAGSAYNQMLDRYLRIVQLLGLERRQRQVPNPVDWAEGKV